MAARAVHWVRNSSTQSLDFVGSPELTTFWLGMRDQQSPLSLLLGLEDTVVAHVLSYTDSAIFMCDCCKDRPLVYCYKKQKRYIKDLTREPHGDTAKGEVPEMLFCNDKMLLWAEKVHFWEFSSKWVSSGASLSGSSHDYSNYSYMACTETGFFSSILSFLWQDIIEFKRIYTLLYTFDHEKGSISFEKSWYEGDPVSTEYTKYTTGIGFDTKRAPSFLKIIQSKVRHSVEEHVTIIE
jgi:hypothetical protein